MNMSKQSVLWTLACIAAGAAAVALLSSQTGIVGVVLAAAVITGTVHGFLCARHLRRIARTDSQDGS